MGQISHPTDDKTLANPAMLPSEFTSAIPPTLLTSAERRASKAASDGNGARASTTATGSSTNRVYMLLLNRSGAYF
jgi:hypothetical protein